MLLLERRKRTSKRMSCYGQTLRTLLPGAVHAFYSSNPHPLVEEGISGNLPMAKARTVLCNKLLSRLILYLISTVSQTRLEGPA